MKKLSLAYFGTPLFSANFLEKILQDKTLPVEVKLVVTQPDKPVGKKQILTPSPVKEIAKKARIPVLNDLGGAQRSEHAHGVKNMVSSFLEKTDLALVCAYGQIIPKELLTRPKYGFWNIHYSLLPKYRGASPVAYALMAGEKKTGVTIFQMDEKIDHGPIVAQSASGGEILPDDRRPDLEKKLTDLAFEIFKKTVFNKDSLQIEHLKGQNHSLATYSKILTREDGFIPFETLKKALKNDSTTTIKIYNLFRGLYPWPGLWTILPNGKRLKITDLALPVTRYTLPIKKVQLEGKKEVDFETFNRAYHLI